MAKKSLIVYASVTGNTEKVAKKFQEVFEKRAHPGVSGSVTPTRLPKNPIRSTLPITSRIMISFV